MERYSLDGLNNIKNHLSVQIRILIVFFKNEYFLNNFQNDFTYYN